MGERRRRRYSVGRIRSRWLSSCMSQLTVRDP
jgi:hypothetical protein